MFNIKRIQELKTQLEMEKDLREILNQDLRDAHTEIARLRQRNRNLVVAYRVASGKNYDKPAACKEEAEDPDPDNKDFIIVPEELIEKTNQMTGDAEWMNHLGTVTSEEAGDAKNS